MHVSRSYGALKTLVSKTKKAGFEAIKVSDSLQSSGAWYSLIYEDGTSEKFQASGWTDKLKDDKFKDRVVELMNKEIIMRFENKEGPAGDFL